MTISGVMRGDELLRWVDAKPQTLGQAWLEGLEVRKREEAEFHDADRAGRRRHRAGFRVAQTIDAAATRALRLKYWTWMFTFELVKVR